MVATTELSARRARLVADARALHGKGILSAVDSVKFSRLMSEAEQLKGRIAQIERADAEISAMSRSLDVRAGAARISRDEASARQKLESDTFLAWARGGEAGLNEQQRAVFQRNFRAAQSVGTGSTGGYIVPQGFYDTLIEAQKSYGGMLAAARIIDTDSGNPLPIPTTNDTAQIGAILAENAQATTQDETFGQITLGAYTYTSKIVLVSNQLLQDSAFDMNSFLARTLGTRIARIVNNHMTVGTGTAQPNGIVTAGFAGFTLPAGNTTSITYAGLSELQHSVDPAYRQNAVFMLSDTMLKKIKQLVDAQNRPLWLPGIAVKEPDTILGAPYIINQDLAVPAANAKTMLYGDFSNYFIRRVNGVVVMRLVERYADFNQTGFVAFQRWDGNLIDAGTHPITYLTQSAT